eukprot:Clim_evm5s87 gene=Clim_evmTU5s87
MGQSQSLNISQEDIDRLVESSSFTPTQIKKLYRRFKRLDTNNDRTISTEEFLAIPELAMNPLIPRIIQMFDLDGTDHVNFFQFVNTLAVFKPTTDREKKLQYCFQIYDVDGDGKVGAQDLFTILKLMVGSNISTDQLQQIVDKTIAEADLDHDGFISFDEFSEVFDQIDLERKMSISF